MKAIKGLLKLILAGLTACAILTAFCSIYSRWPVHLPNPEHNTDYIWQPDYRWMLMTEGISWGRIDGAGYNNEAVIPDPNVLVLGSSHMEAKNVPQGKSTASVLQTLLGPEYRVYNMGVSGHFFAKVCQYLPENLARYETPPAYVILETDSLTVTEKDLSDIRNHTVEFTPSYTEGPVAKLQRNPFFRHVFHQLTTGWMALLMPEKAPVLMTPRTPAEPVHAAPPAPAVYTPEEEAIYDALFADLEALQEKFGTKIIIFHHPKEFLNSDGSISLQIPREQALFAQSCQAHHILFLDMTEPFLTLCNEAHRLPHGFITGMTGVGHLNADGHRAIARELFETITQLEGGR